MPFVQVEHLCLLLRSELRLAALERTCCLPMGDTLCSRNLRRPDSNCANVSDNIENTVSPIGSFGSCTSSSNINNTSRLDKSEVISARSDTERANRSSEVTTNVSRADTAPSAAASAGRGRSIPLKP